MIETSRLRLRDWREEDIPTFAAMCGDPEVMKYFPALLSYADADAQARRIRAELERDGWGLWAVEIKGGAPFVGFVGLSKPRFTVPANVPSQRVMQRLGMVRDPSADFEHPNVPVGNPMRLHWLWRLSRR